MVEAQGNNTKNMLIAIMKVVTIKNIKLRTSKLNLIKRRLN